MGYHDNAIRCVHYSPEMNMVITGSWDASIKLWDTRVPNCLGSCTLPDKVRRTWMELHASIPPVALGVHVGFRG